MPNSFQKAIFDNMSAADLKSFIKKNILAVITDETACAFSWTGQHNNIEIRYFQFTKLLEGKYVHSFI